MTRAEAIQAVWQRVAILLRSTGVTIRLEPRAVDHVRSIAIRLSQPKGQRRPQPKGDTPVKTLVLLLLGAVLVGCATPATLPPRPDVSFFVHQDPLMVPNPKVAPKRMGARMLQPPPIPAPICLTDADHLALEAYLDQVEAWRTR